MNNNIFDIIFDEKSGFMSQLTLCRDKQNMNWIAPDGFWGKIHYAARMWESETEPMPKMELQSFKENTQCAQAVFSNGYAEVTVTTHFVGENIV